MERLPYWVKNESEGSRRSGAADLEFPSGEMAGWTWRDDSNRNFVFGVVRR